MRYSEESRTKCIGLTIETRPDYCLGPHLSDMLSYGCTRLEIGLQVCVHELCVFGACVFVVGVSLLCAVSIAVHVSSNSWNGLE